MKDQPPQESPSGESGQDSKTDARCQVWRPFRVSQIVMVAVGCGLMATSVPVLLAAFPSCDDACIHSRMARGTVFFIGALFIAGGFAFISTAWMFIKIQDEELLIRNVLWRTRCVGLASVVEAHPGYSGVEFRLANGQIVVGMAVQTSNLRTWVGRRGRGEVVAEQVMRAARSLRRTD